MILFLETFNNSILSVQSLRKINQNHDISLPNCMYMHVSVMNVRMPMIANPQHVPICIPTIFILLYIHLERTVLK